MRRGRRRPRRSVHSNLVGCGIEPRNGYVAGSEAVKGAEGNMCGAAMQGPVALPGSEATSRKKGTRRNLGDLVWPAVAGAIPGRDRKSRRRSCRGTGEESDGSIVLEKPSTKAVRSGGGESGGKGPSRRKRSMLKHAPDTAPATACHKRRRSADRTETGRPSPERRSRSTSDKSPVRASRTPGSVGEVPGNRHLYPTAAKT